MVKISDTLDITYNYILKNNNIKFSIVVFLAIIWTALVTKMYIFLILSTLFYFSKNNNDISIPVQKLLRLLSIFIFAYLIIPISLKTVYLTSIPIASIIIPILGIVGVYCFRKLHITNFSLLSVQCLLLWKTYVDVSNGLQLTRTDWSILPDVILIMCFTLKLFPYIKVPKSYQGAMLLIIILLHMTNYFFAGYIKLQLNGDLSWITNKTYNIFLASLIVEQNPFMQLFNVNIDDASSLINFFKTITPLVYALNTIMLIFQVFVFLFLKNTRTIIIMLIFFDLFHIGIFLSSGIFFYKWIILNTALIYALSDKQITQWIDGINFSYPKKVIFGFVMAFVFDAAFYIPYLGWYDSNVIVDSKVKLYYIDGSYSILPSNLFLDSSVQFAQHRINPVTFRTGAYGASKKLDEREFDCNNQNMTVSAWVQSDRGSNSTRKDFVLRNVLKMQTMNEKINLNFDFYPHHIYSNFSDFNSSKFFEKQIEKVAVLNEMWCITSTDVRFLDSKEIIYEY